MAGLLVLLGIWILKSSLPEIKSSEANVQTAEAGTAKTKNSIFQFPHLWLGALCIFFYVGAEVMAGDAIGTYGKGFGIPTDYTKYFTSVTLGAMLVGYVIGLFTIPKYLSQEAALKYFLLGAYSSAFFLFGAALLYGYSGSLSLNGLTDAIRGSGGAGGMFVPNPNRSGDGSSGQNSSVTLAGTTIATGNGGVAVR